MATPGGPRPGNFPPNFNPNALSNNIQNLKINQQQPSNPGGGNSAPNRPNTSPFTQPPPSFPGNQSQGSSLRGPPPLNALSQTTSPVSHPPPPFASRPPPPGHFPPSNGGPATPHSRNDPRPGPIRGPVDYASGMLQGGPQFPPAMGGMPRPLAGPQPSQPLVSSQPPQMRPNFGNPPAGASSSMGQQGPPFSASLRNGPPPMGSTFPAPVHGMPQSSGSPNGMQTWPSQPQQGTPPMPVHMQQKTFGMAPGPQSLLNQSMSRSQSGQSKLDSEIPRLIQNTAVILHETRQNNQANPPPPATSEYIVQDTGNCSPRYIRCTTNQVPCTADLLSTSGMQLALLVQPLALQHPSEEPIQVVDFGEMGPVRCSRCKGYINPYMKFIDQGRRFICNLCGFNDETPRDYHCNLGPDGRRRDADERPELCRGTVEFLVSEGYKVRDPMPAVFFFLIDVSMNAIQTGATAAACSAISQAISDLPEGPRTMVGIATFDCTIHFYNLKRALQQPLMLVVPDVQDVYTPLANDVIVQLAECRQHLEILLESIPTMFQNSKSADSAFGAAANAAFLAMKSTGGKLLIFQSVLPSTGIGSLAARDADGRSNASAGEKEAHKLLQPMDKTLKTMAIDFAEYQVCVDLFITTQSYVDIASLSVFPRTTGGQVYHYFPFSAVSDPAKLYNDLRWNVTRPQGFEAVMRVRCSQGIQVHEYSGNFFKRNPTDVDLPAIDCDKTIMVSLEHDGKLQEGSECSFQCALLYTTVFGQRRIRISTLSLPCTNLLIDMFRTADLDTQFSCFLKKVANEIPSVPLAQVQDQITNDCINVLSSYRKSCATVSSAGQILLPESLQLLSLYTLALLKSNGLCTDGRIDDRSFWINYVSPLRTPLVISLLYPRMIAVHDLDLDGKDFDVSGIPITIPLSRQHIFDEGIYLLENGEDCLIYVGNSVQQNVMQQLFGLSSVEEISNQIILEQYDNPLSKKLNTIVNEIRRQRCSYLRMKFCKNGDSSGALFFSYMVEDQTSGGPSYPEYVVHVHKQILSKIDSS